MKNKRVISIPMKETAQIALIQLTRTKAFDTFIGGILDTLYWKSPNEFMKWLDLMFFIFSLGYQAIYWLYK